MKVEDGLLQVRELIEALEKFSPDAWIEVKNTYKNTSYDNIIEVDEDTDTNIVTIYFE